MIKVELSRFAEKNFLELPTDKQKIVSKKLTILKSDPLLGKPLSGKLKGLSSIRVWPYRIIYEFDQTAKIIKIHRIQHRKEVYKN